MISWGPSMDRTMIGHTQINTTEHTKIIKDKNHMII
jgi:hypothetical protein